MNLLLNMINLYRKMMEIIAWYNFASHLKKKKEQTVSAERVPPG